MSRLWKHRPSPAMIVAMLALFVAMGGTGYAVTKLPKRSVGPAQLRKNAVRSQHIKAGSITTAKLRRARSARCGLRSPHRRLPAAGASSAAASTAPGDRVGLRRQGGPGRQRATLADQGGSRPMRRLTADTAAVARHAKLADNASKLGGKPAGRVPDQRHDPLDHAVHDRRGHEGDAEGRALHAHRALHASTRRSAVSSNQDQADIIISTTQAKSAFDGDDLLGSLDPGDNIETRQFVNTTFRAPWRRALRGVLGRPRDRRRRRPLHQGVVPVRRRERRTARPTSASSADTSSSRPQALEETARGAARKRRPSCVVAGGGARRAANQRPCGTAPCTTSCTRSPSRRPHLLSAALEAGAEIPFEVAESPGVALGPLPLQPAVRPVRARALPARCGTLPAFAPAVDALARIEGCSAYLRVLGASYVPAAERDRAEAALRGSWRGSGRTRRRFEFEAARFERAYRELESIVFEDTHQHGARAPDRRRARGRALGARLGPRARARRPLRRAAPRRSGRRARGRRAQHAPGADRGGAARGAAAADRGAHGVPQAAQRAAAAEARRRGARLVGLVAHRQRPLAGGAARLRRPLARQPVPARVRRAVRADGALRAAAARPRDAGLAVLGPVAVRARLRAAGRARRPVRLPARARALLDAASRRRSASPCAWRRCAPSRPTSAPCRCASSRRSRSSGW